ncbi:hypothetical protein ACFWZT_00695 [Streptomyces alboflavus]|uniref:hypothetical protein n=1 Tax=Streptomyces alboflavus TaxID=67267 RepID=UPI0036C63720
MARSIRKLLAPALLVAALATGHAVMTDDAPNHSVQADTSWGTPTPADESTSNRTAFESADARAPQAAGDTSWG